MVLWFNSGPLVSKEHCSAPLVSIEHCSGPLVSKEHCSGPLACPHAEGALLKWANIALQKSNGLNDGYRRIIRETLFAYPTFTS